MKSTLIFLSILVITKAQESSSDVTLLTAINNFSDRSYQEIGALKIGQSIVISGLSINTAFSFLSAGARGDTQNELVSALGFPNQSTAEAAFKQAITNINKVQGLTLNMANKLFLQDLPYLDLNPDFKQTAVDVFNSDVEKIDFSDTNQAVTTINSWVADKTNQKIKETVTPDVIDPNTRLVLVNAIYFKGKWEEEFNATLTRTEDFNKNSNSKVQVDMMQRTGIFGYLHKKDWNANIIELKYKGNESSMVIILPKSIDGLAAVESKVINSNLKKDVFDAIKERYIEFGIPKFKIETSIDLKKVMPKLGVKSIFGAGADLTGLLNTTESLFVSSAIHKGFIEINEEGTEAAAVTAIIMETFSITPSFICNKPFMFLIKLATGEILFSGRFTGSDIEDTTPRPIGETNVNSKPFEIDCNLLPRKLRAYCLGVDFSTVRPRPTPSLGKKSRLRWY